MQDSKTEGLKIQRILFLIVFGLLFLLVLLLVRPFLTILLWSTLVYGITYPLYRKITTDKLGKPRRGMVRTTFAALFSLGSIVLFVIPLILLAGVIISQMTEFFTLSLQIFRSGTQFFSNQGFIDLAARIAELTGGTLDLRAIDFQDQIQSVLVNLSSGMINLSTGILEDLLRFLVALAFFVFFLFFMYRDGKELFRTLINAIPLRNSYTLGFMRIFRDTGKELAIGYIFVALFQGVMAFAVFAIMKVPAPLPLALLATVTSLIPLVGAGLVWVPVVLMRLATGSVSEAVLLTVLCTVFISGLDNFIRPFLLHAKMKLHPLLIFISIIGGIQLFGFNGLLLGPIILVLFFSAVDMFGQAYGKQDYYSHPAEDLSEPESGTRD
ncbi:MAG: AI-2E family transporter [Clostridia bacterium]|jgi:predicted PurR-regulated permease PerM